MESDEIQFVFTQRKKIGVQTKNWCTKEGVIPSSGRIAMTNVGYVHHIMRLQFRFQLREREVALASSVLTLMPHKSSGPESMQRAAE
ncbi:hypothetical protein T03_6868 [Trichinella britovi]|uniref:Uncharacterized protein n=1 Tax=Trichinella britovi TaxID=45882 RepID=A0A0V1C8L5_TRIBR|nr:hypothetical protein T03_6868 [Trichinella britovi]